MKKVVKLTESELINIVKKVIQEQDNSEEEFQHLDFKTNIDECFEIIPRFYFGETAKGSDETWEGGDLWFWNKNKIPELDDKKAYNRFIKTVKDAVGYEHGGKGGMSNPEMIINEDCFDYDNEPSWKELLPYINHMYFETIKKKKLESQLKSVKSDKDAIKMAHQLFGGNMSGDNFAYFVDNLSKKYNLEIPLKIRRKLSGQAFVSYLRKVINEMSPLQFINDNGGGDEFDYADYVLEKVINDYYADFVSIFMENTEAYDEFYNFVKDDYADLILETWIDEIGVDD